MIAVFVWNSTPVVYGVSDTVEMEALVELVDTLKAMSKVYQGDAGDEHCALAVGLGYLKEALEVHEFTRFTRFTVKLKESRMQNVMAIGWRVEHDLAQFVRSVLACTFGAQLLLRFAAAPECYEQWLDLLFQLRKILRSQVNIPFPTAYLNFNPKGVLPSRGQRPGRVQWRGDDCVSILFFHVHFELRRIQW